MEEEEEEEEENEEETETATERIRLNAREIQAVHQQFRINTRRSVYRHLRILQ